MPRRRARERFCGQARTPPGATSGPHAHPRHGGRDSLARSDAVVRRISELLFTRRVTSYVRRVLFDGLLPPLVRDFGPANRLVRRLWLGDGPMRFHQEAWGYDAEARPSVYGAAHGPL